MNHCAKILLGAGVAFGLTAWPAWADRQSAQSFLFDDFTVCYNFDPEDAP